MTARRVTWDEFKGFVDLRGSIIQENQLDDGNLLLEAHDGPLIRFAKVKSDTTEMTDYTTNYQSAANQKQDKSRYSPTTGTQELVIKKQENFFSSKPSHDWTKKETWYQESVQVTGETPTLVSGLTYAVANTWIIDATHNKIVGERNKSFDFVTFQYTTPLRETYCIRVYDNAVELTEDTDYTVNHELGQITFTVAPGGPITVDYYYASGSGYSINGEAGKIIKISKSEVNMSVDVGFTSLKQEFLVTIPGPSEIAAEIIYYEDPRDYITIGNGGKGFIPKFSNLSNDVLVFPFDYIATISIAEGQRIRISTDNDLPMTGEWANVTLYTEEETI